MNKEFEEKEQEIKSIRDEYSGIIADLEARLERAKRTRDEKVAQLQQERDAIALELKLKEFPTKLVQEHATCSVCGGLMRPFKTADQEGKVRKYWACQNGSLQDTHDLVVVA